MNQLAKIDAPTTQFYNGIQIAFQFFNEKLFDNSLPDVMLTTQRQKMVMGYFSPERWGSALVKGESCHEIAINPTYVARSSLIEFFQTLVHEMCHLWQQCHGNPGRTGYHNKEWADKMMMVGLMPSDTGRPGGKTTGDHMNDYPASEGKFIQSCMYLIENEGYALKWVDRFAKPSLHSLSNNSAYIRVIEDMSETLAPELVSALSAPMSDVLGVVDLIPDDGLVKTNVKIKYQCHKCKASVWGKPLLNIQCLDCQEKMGPK